MIEHNNVVKNGSKKRNPLKRSLELASRGFSLVELMVAVAIGSIVSLLVSSVFVFAIEQFTILVEQNAAEENLLWAAYSTRSFLTQATDIKVWNDPLPLTMTSASDGYFINSYSSTATPGKTTLIALFGRESAVGAAAGTSSNITPVGIFFASAANTAAGSSQNPIGGTLYFDAPNALNATLSPSLDDVWYDRISEYRIEDVECVTATGTGTGAACTNGLPVKSATVVIKARYFKTVRRSDWVWQQMSAVPAGTTVGPFRDSQMSIKVGFRNNLLTASKVGTGGEERLHGGLYFFRMLLPPLR